MTKNKNLLKNIAIIFCLIPMLVLSFLPFFSFNKKINVYADSVDKYFSYSSSTLYIPVKRYGLDSQSVLYLDLINWNISLLSSTSGVTLDISSVTGFLIIDTISWQGQQFNYKNINDYYFDSSLTNQSLTIANGSTTSTYIYCTQNSSQFKYSLSFESSSSFNCDIYSIEMGNTGTSPNYYNFVRYTDTNGGTFTIKFYVSSIIKESDLLNYRMYYLSPDFSNENIYDIGYGDGYNNGLVDGNEQGYTDGYNAGNTIGYNNGYVAGQENANTYTFASLLGAVIDVPVNAFTSLLNFEILGVNILGFVCGLITLALIIFIIKLCLGGK